MRKYCKMIFESSPKPHDCYFLCVFVVVVVVVSLIFFSFQMLKMSHSVCFFHRRCNMFVLKCICFLNRLS